MQHCMSYHQPDEVQSGSVKSESSEVKWKDEEAAAFPLHIEGILMWK